MAFRTIVVIAPDTRVVECSEGMGFEQHRVEPGLPVIALWPALMRPEVERALGRAANGHIVEDLPTLEDGERQFRVSAYPLPAKNGAVERVLLIADPIPSQASEGTQAGAGSAMTEMASVIAHELRNPLAAVRSVIEVVGRQMAGPNRVPIEQVLARIDAMDALLDDLLLFSITPAPHLHPVALEPLIHSVVHSLSAHDAAKIHVATAGPIPLVNGDETLLKAAFLNLLMNAVQATTNGEPIDVVLDGGGGGVSAAITDHGHGFSVEAREAMFQPFFTTKARGTGLGLPTARRLIEAQGGQITVDSRPSGARVVVTLPSS